MAEPDVVRHHLAPAPATKADEEAAVRVAEDVVPKEDVDGLAILVLLPTFRPELGVVDEVVEHLGTDVVASLLELLAEIVTADGTALLLLREEEVDLLPVEVEVVSTTFELDDTRSTMDFERRSDERKPRR